MCYIYNNSSGYHSKQSSGLDVTELEKLGDGQNTDSQSMDSPNGLPLKWTTPKNDILNEYCLKL